VNERSEQVREVRLELQEMRRQLEGVGHEWAVIQNEETNEQISLEESLTSVSGEAERLAGRLQVLMRINPLNDTFFIWFLISTFNSKSIHSNFINRYEGPFATINGFRLGRLPSYPVDWPEVNCGLGEVRIQFFSSFFSFSSWFSGCSLSCGSGRQSELLIHQISDISLGCFL